MVHPFSTEVSLLISRISYLALEIAIVTAVGNNYCIRLVRRGADLLNLHEYLGGAGEILFLGGIIFIIAQIFKTGIEIQSENELTI